MKNIQTREGFEFWDKICSVPSYGFLLSPDKSRIQRAPDVGSWIEKYEAQTIVSQAQDEINRLKEDLASADADKEAYAQNAIDLRRRLDRAIEMLYETGMDHSRIAEISIR